MKTIAIDINVEGDSCNGCHALDTGYDLCSVFNERIEYDWPDNDNTEEPVWERLPACIEAEQLHKDAVELAELWKQLEPSMKFREVMNKLGYVDAACETANRILKGGGDE